MIYQGENIDQLLYEPYADVIYAYKSQNNVLTRIYSNSKTDHFNLKGVKQIQMDSELGTISNKMSILTIFSHKQFKQKKIINFENFQNKSLAF